jgi:taurine dioxygenase
MEIAGAGGLEAAPRFEAIEARPVSAALGAEIRGVNLSRPLSDDLFAELRRALAHFGVIFVRDQRLTPEQHIAFAERWGPINVNRFFRPVAGYPMIAEVRKEPHQITNIGGGWHTDHSYDRAPALGSILYAHEVPAVGGDTLYASMYLAYETLSDGLKAMLEGLRARHSSRHVFGAEAYEAETDIEGRTGKPELAVQDASHPVVIRHPESGRKALYVNPYLGFRRLERGGIEAAARLSLRPRHPAGVPLPFPLGKGLARHVGQPGDLALCPQRLPRPAPPPAPRHHRGRAAWLRGG